MWWLSVCCEAQLRFFSIAQAQQLPSGEHIIHATRCFPAKKSACYLSRNGVGRPQLTDCSGCFLIVLPTKAWNIRSAQGELQLTGRAASPWGWTVWYHFVQRWNMALSSVSPASEITEAWTIAKSKGENPSKALISVMISSNLCLPDRPVFQKRIILIFFLFLRIVSKHVEIAIIEEKSWNKW